MTSITNTIADLVRQTNPDLDTRLEFQAEALSENTCIDPRIGRWIDENDVKYLFALLDLDDEAFTARVAATNHASLDARRQLIEVLEEHLERCPHCSLKRGYDFELDAQIKKACQQNSHLLLRMLEEDGESLTEGEHQALTASR